MLFALGGADFLANLIDVTYFFFDALTQGYLRPEKAKIHRQNFK